MFISRLIPGILMLAAVAAEAAAPSATVTVTFADGRVETRREGLTAKGPGIYEWRAAKTAFTRPVASVEVLPDFAKAAYGDDGWFMDFVGDRGRFNDPGSGGKRRFCQAHDQFNPLYAMKTPRTTFVAFPVSMKWHAGVQYLATNGVYAISHVFHEDLDELYEDLAIEYHLFDDPKADYNELAQAYREYQLQHEKKLRPLAERAKERPELAYAMKYPEVRVRLAWKPVPATVSRQVPENEPPVTPHVPFARVTELAAKCREAGVEGAEFCLVGWNKGGHDGAYPQLFPVEPSLGGEPALRKSIRDVQALGYQIVAHANHEDAYMLADCWDLEYIMNRDADGRVLWPTCTWGGGAMHKICPQRAYEKFALRDAARVAALGFRGLHYLDVLSCHVLPNCRDRRHCTTRADNVRWDNAILDLETATFGGVASEGACDACIAHLDSVLTVSWVKPFAEKSDRELFNLDPVPFWQLLYHGYVLSTPFRNIMNATANPDPRYLLKLAEFGGRPTFYVHSRFQTKANANMGDRDLRAETDEELADSVACIRRGYDEYARRAHLQNHFMLRHERLAEGVYRTVYSNGESLLSNYRGEPYVHNGVTIPATGWTIAETVSDAR